MKRSFAFCLALILGGILLGAADIARGMVSLPPIGPMPTNPPTKLRLIVPWTNITVKLVVPGTSNPPVKCVIEEAPAQWAEYEVVPAPDAPYLHQFAILAIHDPHAKMNCILGANNMFYASGKSGMMGFFVHGTGAHWAPSYLELPDDQGDLNAAIRKFEKEFDGAKLNNHVLDNRKSGVGFQKVSPLFYNLVAPIGGSKLAEMKIENFEIVDGIVRVDVRNMTTHTLGSYWLDPQQRKITQSIVGGHHMSLQSNSPWADPLD